jgi:hypothetical protein
VRIGLRVNEPQYLQLMLDRLPPGWKPAVSPVVVNMYSLLLSRNSPSTNVRRFSLLYAGGIRAARSLDHDLVLKVFEWKGQAIVIPGRSMSGKSTLTAALVRAGATYYSDEYAVLDEQGRVHAYPRLLGLRSPGTDEQTKVRAEELGGRVGSKPLPVGMVVVSQYHEGARWRPRKLTPGQGALEVLANTVPARTRPEESLTSIQQAVTKASIFKGRRGDAKETAHLILESLSRS